MPVQRKRVSDEVMTRIADAITVLAADESAPRTKRQIEHISGLSHDVVARAFRQDADQPENQYRLTERLSELVAPLSSARRSPVAEAQHQDKQKIAELKQQVSELNKQLDRYAMTLFAFHLASQSQDTPSGDVIPIRRDRRLKD